MRDLRDLKDLTMNDLFAGKLYAGGVAGCVSRTVTAPIDRVKTVRALSTALEAPQGKNDSVFSQF